jgi:uncharacterized membrane protein YfcA
MESLELHHWIALAIAALFTGMAKSGVVGLGMISIPLLAATFPSRESTGTLLLLLIFGDVCAVTLYRRHAEWKILLKLFPAAMVGIVIGWRLMAYVDNAELRVIIGVIVLVLVGLQTVLRRVGLGVAAAHPAGAATTGILAGISTMMANAAGPLMVLYMLLLKLEKQKFVGTLAWYFFVLNLFKVPFSAGLGLITLDTVKMDALMIPIVVVGALSGFYLVKVIPQRVFELLVSVLAAAGGIYLIVG